MKKKLKTLLLTSVLGVMVFGLTGCGQGKVSQEQKEAVEYYENLGIGKEDAEDLAEAIVGNGSANNNASEENIDNAAESSLPVVDIMPEIANGTMNDYIAQFFDMLFRCDLTMTPEEVKKVIDDSDFDFTYEEEWCACGKHAIIYKIYLNEKEALSLSWLCGEAFCSDEYAHPFSQVKQGCFLSGVMLPGKSVPIPNSMQSEVIYDDEMLKNFHVPGVIDASTYFTNRDDVLAFAKELGCVESPEGFNSSGTNSSNLDAYGTESLYYNSPQEVRIYWVEKILESDERVEKFGTFGQHFCQGVSEYRSFYVRFAFNPDGTMEPIDSFDVKFPRITYKLDNPKNNYLNLDFTYDENQIASCSFFDGSLHVEYGPKID